MDNADHSTLRRFLLAAVLVDAALVGALVSEVWAVPGEAKAWIFLVLAVAALAVVGQARRLLHRAARTPTPSSRN